MRRVALIFVVGLLAALGLSVVPAAALDVALIQEAPPQTEIPAEDEPVEQAPAEVPATWRMSVVAGVDGWVSPNEPLPLRVNLSSDLLLVGRIDVSIGGVTTSQAVEIPAGGVKDYFIQAGTPGQRRQLRVQLTDESGTEETILETAQVSLRVPADEIVVAVVDAAPYESTIRSATPKPLAQEVAVVRLAGADVANLNSAVSYLVLPTGAMADLSADAVETVRRWVDDGGRLVASGTNVSRLVDPAGGKAFRTADAVAVTLGAGEVTAVNDFDSLDAADWSELIRSVPQPGIVRIQEDGGSGSLISAALSGRSASVPALPWLLLGILLFVVLVGPVNFIVLRGFGKPEWAWLTVPLLSAVFVAGFWIVGRSQLQPFTVTHTSVVVQSEFGAEGRTAFVLQVESGGDHDLRFGDGWNSEGQAFPGAESGVTSTDSAGRTVISYDLADLGVGTAQGAWAEDTTTELVFTVAATDNGFTINASNPTSNVFQTWGFVVDGLGFLASEPLVAQGEGSVEARITNRRSNRFQPVIMEAVERRGFFDENFYATEYQQIFPMAVFAEQMAPGLKENGIHFFGFTEDEEYPIEVNGDSAASTGSTLLVAEVPDDGSILAARTSARPRLLGVEGSASVEQYYEEIYAYGAEAVYLHYVVPNSANGGSVEPGFTRLSNSSVYDWVVGDYVAFEWGDTLDFNRVTSPTGEVVIKAARAEDDQFFDESLNLSRFSMNWG